ncbi:hypothetical protein [Nanobdella aerobiophila]|uniref:hypothetical protein n=1 Tax=Nanobdella aerobiophila TaxID=2586965 RepID=UPI0021ACF0DE|nr:hypothetical protein [Nanobdella aerobiophila]
MGSFKTFIGLDLYFGDKIFIIDFPDYGYGRVYFIDFDYAYIMFDNKNSEEEIRIPIKNIKVAYIKQTPQEEIKYIKIS